MLGGAQHPEAGGLRDLEAAAQIAGMRKGNNLHRSRGDVVNGAVERSGAIAGQQNPGNAKEGCRAKDGADVVWILNLIEGQPEPMARSSAAVGWRSVRLPALGQVDAEQSLQRHIRVFLDGRFRDSAAA